MEHDSGQNSSETKGSPPAPSKSRKSKSILIVALIVVAIAGACAWAFISNQAKSQRPEPGVLDAVGGPSRGRVVCAIKDLPALQEITEDSLEVREVYFNKAPNDAFDVKVGVVVGQGPLRPISSGEIIRYKDITHLWNCCIAAREIKKGSKISEQDLSEKIIDSHKTPHGALLKWEVIGARARCDIHPNDNMTRANVKGWEKNEK